MKLSRSIKDIFYNVCSELRNLTEITGRSTIPAGLVKSNMSFFLKLICFYTTTTLDLSQTVIMSAIRMLLCYVCYAQIISKSHFIKFNGIQNFDVCSPFYFSLRKRIWRSCSTSTCRRFRRWSSIGSARSLPSPTSPTSKSSASFSRFSWFPLTSLTILRRSSSRCTLSSLASGLTDRRFTMMEQSITGWLH